jgi:hypothetical protein
LTRRLKKKPLILSYRICGSSSCTEVEAGLEGVLVKREDEEEEVGL